MFTKSFLDFRKKKLIRLNRFKRKTKSLKFTNMKNFHLRNWSVVCSCTLVLQTEILLLELNTVFLAVTPRQSIEHLAAQQLLAFLPKHKIIRSLHDISFPGPEHVLKADQASRR